MEKNCLCGCGATVVRQFRPGHDGRARSRLQQRVRAKEITAQEAIFIAAGQGWSDALIDQLKRVLDR